MARTRGRGRGRARGGRDEGPSQEEPEIQEEAPSEPEVQVEEEEESDAELPTWPLLTLQKYHRVSWLIKGRELPRPKVRHSIAFLDWDDRYRPYLLQSGFYGIYQITGWMSDPNLVMGFIERWRQETHTFNLPVGEMTITLEDVAVLLGLPVDGIPLCDNTDQKWPQIVFDCLGIRPEGTAWANKSALRLGWLRHNFMKLPQNASEDQVQCYVRAYILIMLANFVFLDTTGDSIPCVYLPMLQDLSRTSSYAWGAALLARLYRNLCRGCKPNTMQIGGVYGSFTILDLGAV